MRAVRRYSSGNVCHDYKCSGAKRKLGCTRKAIKKERIEKAVVWITVTKALTDEAIDRIADTILKFIRSKK